MHQENETLNCTTKNRLRLNNFFFCSYEKYVGRLLSRVDADIGITFPEFKVFGQFLNNLEDFMIAMRMYTLADHPISKGTI